MITLIAAAEFECLPTMEWFKLNDIPFEFFPLGIGPLQVAQNLEKVKNQVTGKDVIYVGTCGSWQPFSEIELVTVEQSYWLPVCERLEAAESIEHLHPPQQFSKRPAWLNLPNRIVLTGPTIASTPFIADQIQKRFSLPTELLVENLEAYLVSALCPFAQSLAPILAVTNEVGTQGRQQWRAYFQQAALKTAEYLRSRFPRAIYA